MLHEIYILVTALGTKKMPTVANLKTTNVPLGIGHRDYPLEDKSAFRGKAAVTIHKRCQTSSFPLLFLNYVFNLKKRAMVSLSS